MSNKWIREEDELHIIAYGTPGSQGSKSFKGVDKAGKGILVEASPYVRNWRMDVKQAAQKAIEEYEGTVPFTGPVLVDMVFTFNRPTSASIKKRPFPSVYPDLSKILRSTEDALTDAGVWKSDAQVVEFGRLAKVYADEDEDALSRPGVWITVVPVSGAANALLNALKQAA